MARERPSIHVRFHRGDHQLEKETNANLIRVNGGKLRKKN
jgi:hypothetical protein